MSDAFSQPLNILFLPQNISRLALFKVGLWVRGCSAPGPSGHRHGLRPSRLVAGPEGGPEAPPRGLPGGPHHLGHPPQLPVRPLEARAERAPAARGAQRGQREPQDRLHRRGPRAVFLRRSVTSVIKQLIDQIQKRILISAILNSFQNNY